MPTGYTAKMFEGHPVTLREFAFECARAFGALIHMRDDPMDAPLPVQIEPDTRHDEERLREAQVRLDHILALDDAGIAAECDFHNHEEWSRYEERRLETERCRARYTAMLDEVKRHPFAKELEGLRGFMIQQLEASLDYDCRDHEAPVPLSPSQYRDAEIKSVSWDIAYHKKSIAEEIARAAERNEWLQKLYASFPAEAA